MIAGIVPLAIVKAMEIIVSRQSKMQNQRTSRAQETEKIFPTYHDVGGYAATVALPLSSVETNHMISL
jgi:hypothetical protein